MAGFFQKRPYREAPSQLPDLADHLSLAKRLVASWSMANGTAHDLGPYARHGVKSQHVSMPTTRHGRTAFHNATQEATPIDIGTIESGHPLTFSGKDQHSSFFLMKQVGIGNGFSRIYEKSSGGSSANGYGLVITSSGAIFWYQSGSKRADTVTSTIILDTWYAVGISVDGSGSVSNIYVNGIDVTNLGGASTFATNQTNMALLGWNHSASRIFNGYLPFLHLWDYPLSAAEHSRLARNPFMLYERRVWVPVSAVGPETGAITEGATGTESFIGTASAFSLFADAINAADVKSGVAAALAELLDGSLVDSIYGGTAAASAGIVDGVDATEGDAPTASATGVTVESAEADLLIDAIAQAAAAILAAAQAGEVWVASLSGLVGNIIEAAEADLSFEPSAQASARIDALVNAGEAWVAQLVGVEVGVVSANTEASDAFFSAAQTIASIVQTASAGEIMIAMAQALARISEAANASEAFTALVAGLLGQFSDGASVDAEILSRADMVASMFEDGAAGDAFTGETVVAPLGELLAAISADALFNATATVSAALSAGALAGAVFSALEPTEALGHLVVGAISIRATLMGIGALGPAIRGKPSVN